MIFHLDISNHYGQKEYTVLGLVSVTSDNKKDGIVRKGLVITDPTRKDLLKDYSDMQLHSALISLLIDGVRPIKKIIICPDITPIDKVIGLVCDLSPELVLGKLKSLNELREELGNPHYKSEADAFVKNINKNFKKRRNAHRRKDYFTKDNIIIISNKNSNEYKLLLEKVRSFIESNR